MEAWMKDVVTEIKVKDLDESVTMRLYNNNKDQLAFVSWDVESIEELIGELQEAVKKAKESKWYEPKE